MDKSRLFLVMGLFSIGLVIASLPDSYSSIPPTNGFFQFWLGNQNITAQNTTSKLNLVEGSNINLVMTNANNTLKISSTVTGNNTVYRCIGEGTLPDGTLTTNNLNCLSSITTGLKVN